MKKEELNNKKNKYTALILIVVLLISVVGFTFAYFMAAVGGDTVTDVTLEIESSKVVTFDSGEKLYLLANRANFTEDYETLYDSSTLKASLTSQVEETIEYDITFNITNNEMTYTTEEQYPEVILLIEDNEGNVIKEIEGLTFYEASAISSYAAEGEEEVEEDATDEDTDKYIANEEVQGFDITNKQGEFTVILNNALTTDSFIEHEWTMTLYFVNLDSMQDDNINKKLNIEATIELSEVVEEEVGE